MKRKILPISLQAIFSLKQDFHVLVIDDSSPDGTADIVRGLAVQISRQNYSSKNEKANWAWALPTYMVLNGLLKKVIQYIFEMDADFSHNPNDLQRLYEACKIGGADVAIGSRYVKGGGTINWP